MAKLSVKKDDYVMIIAGKDKGKTAQVTAVNAEKHRVLIEGDGLLTVNTKAVKARKASDKGGLIKQPGSVHPRGIPRRGRQESALLQEVRRDARDQEGF